MHPVIRPLAIALAVILSSAALAGSAIAQTAKKATPRQTEPAPVAAPIPMMPKQIALTEKQIEAVLASLKDLDAIAEKLPENAPAKPDPKVEAQLDDVARKNGFASYGEYNEVVENIGLVLNGFDPQTKQYVGPEAVLKQQIAAVQADKKMPAKDKKQALAELNAALKSPPPAVENKGNIDLVARYYDKLAAAMQDE